MFPRVSTFLFLLLFASQAAGISVTPLDKKGTLLAVRLLNDNEWRINDFLCIKTPAVKTKEKKTPATTVACGQVVRATRSILVVQVNLHLEKKLALTNAVLTRVNPTERNLASLLNIHAERLRKPSDFSQVSVGVLSVLAIWPFLHFEQALMENLTVGLLPNYLRTTESGGTLAGFGLDVTFNFYHKRPFEGLWAMAGGGVGILTLEQSGASTTILAPNAIGTLGYKIRTSSEITYGASVGAQYFLGRLSGVRLNFLLTVGFVF